MQSKVSLRQHAAQQPPFAWDLRYWPTLADFRAYLSERQPAKWVKGVTIHNTLAPTPSTWLGKASMLDMKDWWQNHNGWSSGPQLVIAPDGIWQGTPIDTIGVHAGACNSSTLGVEIVGDYNKTYWQEPIKTYVYGVLQALALWLKLTPDDIIIRHQIKGHSECMDKPICPGSKIDLNKLRGDIAMAVTATKQQLDMNVIGTKQSLTLQQFVKACSTAGLPSLSADESARVYNMATWLEIDLSFIVAVAKDYVGSDLANGHVPIPLLMPIGDWRPTLTIGGNKYAFYESWQLGWFAILLHLKNVYGAGGLLTVRKIVATMFPSSRTNNQDQIVAKILERMQSYAS